MMYRKISTAIWTHVKIKPLDTPTKLFALYLITNFHTHLSGIYYLPTVTSAYETGLADRLIRKAYPTLEEIGFSYFDPKTDVVFVKKMFKRQAQGEKHLIAAATHLPTLNKSGLIRQFLRQYPEVVPHLPKGFWGYPIDDPSWPRPKDQDQDQDQEQDKDQDQDQKPDRCADAFTVWLGHDNLIQHKTLSRKMRSTFNARIKDGYKPKDINAAFDRYSILKETKAAPGYGDWGFAEVLGRGGGEWIDKLNDPNFTGFTGGAGPKKTESERADEIDAIERGLK